MAVEFLPDGFKVRCVVEGIAAQQKKFYQIPRDVTSWIIIIEIIIKIIIINMIFIILKIIIIIMKT